MRATTVRFSEDLWQLLEREAERQGISSAQFIRDSTLLRLERPDAETAGDPGLPTDLPAPVTDPARIAALRATGLLDTPPAPAFDRCTRLVTRFLHVPVALVSLVDEDRQFFKSCLGLAEPWASRRQTPLSHSFCQHVVELREPLVVSDAREHPLLRDSLAIRDLGVIAYAGVPVFDSGGHVLGSLCAIDTEPRVWSEEEIDTLRDLAESVVAIVEGPPERSYALR